jgi:hypothetical protein
MGNNVEHHQFCSFVMLVLLYKNSIQDRIGYPLLLFPLKFAEGIVYDFAPLK